jgi:hypothetical protein
MVCSYFLGEMLVDREDQIDFNNMCRKNVRDLADAHVAGWCELQSQILADILKHLASMYAI